ncbi:hypothetical protein J3L18_25995 [Mucilaginibacter gossypii]|uniref:hypothetical protein n=1 Tax=Mucilaginibacter gossypii TaxID=551996 RepID=UPI000DCE71A3|nr:MULTISPECIES: hypothetical protein [Mucilaginibacter]QTE36543.1 hypothetical protein J3L18_25995 [Mucilaginibacter gossypii]RAV47379.1 hypothetical protein DIU36_29720 [Mucilaginibacter rubeus]
MKELIQQNKFDELKFALQNSNSQLKIHQVLARALNGNHLEETDYGFEANMYQEEFLEGFDLYKVLNKSEIPQNQLQEYKIALTFLVFKMGGFIKLLADKTMQQGLYLSQVENVYKVDPSLRNELQAFIDLLKETNDVQAIANTSAAKAQISLSVADLLEKYEIGQDMLQFARGYEDAGLKDEATRIYINILSDFECESAKTSSNLFPEITHVDTRSNEEIEIFEKAKSRFETITGANLPTIKRVRPDNDANAEKLVEAVDKHEISLEVEENYPISFWDRVKRFFS